LVCGDIMSFYLEEKISNKFIIDPSIIFTHHPYAILRMLKEDHPFEFFISGHLLDFMKETEHRRNIQRMLCNFYLPLQLLNICTESINIFYEVIREVPRKKIYRFDPNKLSDLENKIPNYTHLKEKYPDAFSSLDILIDEYNFLLKEDTNKAMILGIILDELFFTLEHSWILTRTRKILYKLGEYLITTSVIVGDKIKQMAQRIRGGIFKLKDTVNDIKIMIENIKDRYKLRGVLWLLGIISAIYIKPYSAIYIKPYISVVLLALDY